MRNPRFSFSLPDFGEGQGGVFLTKHCAAETTPPQPSPKSGREKTAVVSQEYPPMSAPTRRAVASWAGLAAMAALVPAPGAAQVAWPVRPVRIVVPFAPGGGADLIARMLTPHLQQRLDQSFFVDNRAGAAGRIGAAAVAKADPDGHTLLMTTESSIVIGISA
jgi:hypothetical protein